MNYLIQKGGQIVEGGLVDMGSEKRTYGSSLWAMFCGQSFRRAKSFVVQNIRHLDKNSPDIVSSDKVKGLI